MSSSPLSLLGFLRFWPLVLLQAGRRPPDYRQDPIPPVPSGIVCRMERAGCSYRKCSYVQRDRLLGHLVLILFLLGPRTRSLGVPQCHASPSRGSLGPSCHSSFLNFLSGMVKPLGNVL